MFTCTLCGCLANRVTGVPEDEYVEVWCHVCQRIALEMVSEEDAIVSYEVQRGLV